MSSRSNQPSLSIQYRNFGIIIQYIMEIKICQSCGMPLNQSTFGTNKDSSKNKDYCCYCYKNGDFTQNFTMEQMIEHCIQFLEEFNKDSGKKFTRKEAILQMKEYFPSLKRWKK